MLVNQTVESLRRMRLTGMAEAFLAQGQDPGYRELSFEERFGLLVDRESFSSRYYRLPRLFMDLNIARGDGSYPSTLRKLAKTDLLVLDDWGLGPLTAAESRELLEVLEDRCQTKSTVVASQVPVEKWYELMSDSTVADAVMDRLVHNAHKIALRGESMRKIVAAAQQKGGES